METSCINSLNINNHLKTKHNIAEVFNKNIENLSITHKRKHFLNKKDSFSKAMLEPYTWSVKFIWEIKTIIQQFSTSNALKNWRKYLEIVTNI